MSTKITQASLVQYDVASYVDTVPYARTILIMSMINSDVSVG